MEGPGLATWRQAFGIGLFVLTAVLAVLVGLAWVFPVEFMQNQALMMAGNDSYRQLEAIGRAEAAVWLIRFLGPILLGLVLFARRRLTQIALLWQGAWQGFLQATRVEDAAVAQKSLQKRVAGVGAALGETPVSEALTGASFAKPQSSPGHPKYIETISKPRWAAGSLRVLLAAWLAIAVGQWGAALNHRLTEWPYYRFRSGPDMMPNISDSNREVIRYVAQVTPPQSRILVVSDQKLFFLSYYLLPRRIYHRLHPDSEFVIAQPHQERRLAAYKLEELDPAWIQGLKADYLLEYFEHPENVDRAQVMKDVRWVDFLRRTRRDPQLIPPYLVRLRPLTQESAP